MVGKQAKRKHGSGSESIRKLSKTGTYTYYVTIPKAEIDALGWEESQRLKVRRSGSRIVIEDA
jgi:bifunctional DNA-binding transcriptional regulator/antitoxin component of YhaV-PrlF toxin-antitoxin module